MMKVPALVRMKAWKMAMGTSKRAIVIGGPTASGKTGLAIQVARHFGTEIISFDSRQCFREMKIGVARPTAEELAAVQHHFIASHSIKNNLNAAWFESFALEKAAEIFSKHDHLVLVGGTGLYARAFTDGLDPIPEINSAVRQQILDSYEANGLQWLQESVRNEDPEYYSTGEIMNPHRLIRALEVIRGTGRSIREYQNKFNNASGSGKERPFTALKFTTSLPREELYENINLRVDRMIKEGLIEEVNGLIPYRQLPALNTVGYKEIFSFLDGETTISEAVEKIKQNTRRYAKRQMTWFKKEQYNPVFPSDAEAVINAST